MYEPLCMILSHWIQREERSMSCNCALYITSLDLFTAMIPTMIMYVSMYLRRVNTCGEMGLTQIHHYVGQTITPAPNEMSTPRTNCSARQANFNLERKHPRLRMRQ